MTTTMTEMSGEVDLSFDFKTFDEDAPELNLSDEVKEFNITIYQRETIKYTRDEILSLAKIDAKPPPEVARKLCFLFPHNPKSNCLSTHETRVKEIRAEVNKVTADNLGKIFKHIKRLINTRRLVQTTIDYIVENAVSSLVLMDPLITLCEMLANDPVCSSFVDPIGVINSELLYNLQKRFFDRKWLLYSSSSNPDLVDKYAKKKDKYKNTVTLIAKLYAMRKEGSIAKLYMPEKSVLGCLDILKSEDCNYNENFECAYCILNIAGKYLDNYANAWFVDKLFEWFRSFTGPNDKRMASHNKIQFIPEICELKERKWIKKTKNIDTVLIQKQKPNNHNNRK